MAEDRAGERSVQRQVVLVAAVLALLLALLVLLVATAGGSRFGEARTGGVVDVPLLSAAQDVVDRTRDVPEPQPDARPPRWLPVLLVLLVSVLLALAVRTLQRLVRRVDGPEDAPTPVGDAGGDPRAPALDELRRATRSAAEDLRRDGAGAADAVVLCWERLELLGGDLGTPRPKHETPTEFGADLLRRHGADPVAVDELLHLYHRARFGSRRGSEAGSGIGAGDGDRAAAALARVADTLHDADAHETAPTTATRTSRG